MLNDVAAEISPSDVAESAARGLRAPEVRLSTGLQIRRFDEIELVVARKTTPGFTAEQVDVLHALVRDISSGAVGPCKFLVLDLASRGSSPGKPPRGFEACVEDLSNLIFQLPVLSVAWVRQDLAGMDLEIALACSMAVAEEGARLTFDVDLVDSLRTYALLAHKIGFVQAERLMEGGSTLTAAEAYAAMVLHSVAPPSDGVEGIRGFVSSRTRRHNSACGLYRAQRIAMLGPTH